MTKEQFNDYVLISGSSNPELASKIGGILDKEVCFPVRQFADGEIKIDINVSLRGKDVFIIQSTAPPAVDKYYMETFFLASAARRTSAKDITAVLPYYGYSRQDKMHKQRSPIAAADVAQILVDRGVKRLLTIDLHSEQIQSSISDAWDNLYASSVLIPEIRNLKLGKIVVASPDKGGVERATTYQDMLEGEEDIAVVYKKRDPRSPNRSRITTMIGDVEDKDVLITDDIIDTGGTLMNAANLLKQKGARSVRAAITHGIFSKFEDRDPLMVLEHSAIETLFVTDTIRHRDEVLSHPKIKVVSVAPLFAEAIKRINYGESISELFRYTIPNEDTLPLYKEQYLDSPSHLRIH